MEDSEEYYSFDEGAIQEALDSLDAVEEEQGEGSAFSASAQDAASSMLATSATVSIQAQCISVQVSNRRICLNLPLGIGRVCLPIPARFPNGTAAQACISIKTRKVVFVRVPCGVEVTVRIAGATIVRQTFGFC